MGHELGNPIENEQLCKSARSALQDGIGGLSVLPSLIMKIIEVRAWEKRKVRGRIVEFESLHALITSKATAGGWQEDPKKIELILKDEPRALTMWREAMKRQGGDRRSEEAKSNGDNITVRKETPKGTSKAYTLSRLQREAPELFQQVCDGELSANAAAIEAGFRKKPTVVGGLQAGWKKATEDERAEFLEWIGDKS